MADNVQSGMSQPILVPGMRVVLEALDPSSGANISAVKVSNVVISGSPVSLDDDDDLGTGPFMLVPGPESVA